MMAHRRGVESRIDAAKKYAQARRNYIADGLVLGGYELFFSWFPGLRQKWLGSLNFKTRFLRSTLF